MAKAKSTKETKAEVPVEEKVEVTKDVLEKMFQEAKKEALIAEAEGQATAIKMIIDAHPDEAYIKLQSFEALKALAVGQSTKIVVPTDIANITGALTAGSEIVKMPETPVKPAKK